MGISLRLQMVSYGDLYDVCGVERPIEDGGMRPRWRGEGGDDVSRGKMQKSTQIFKYILNSQSIVFVHYIIT